MIIQGSPDILRGPQGLNGFGDFGETAAKAVQDAKGVPFDRCPPGSKMENGVCVPDSSTYGPGIVYETKPDETLIFDRQPHVDETGRYEAHMRQLKAEEDAKILAQQNTGVSPLLILVAAAAFFIGG